jgi:hypothetical protein
MRILLTLSTADCTHIGDTIDVLAEAVIAFSRDGLTRTVKMGTEKTATKSAYESGGTSK